MTVNRYHEMNERNPDLSTAGAHHLLSSRTILEIIIYPQYVRRHNGKCGQSGQNVPLLILRL